MEIFVIQNKLKLVKSKINPSVLFSIKEKARICSKDDRYSAGKWVLLWETELVDIVGAVLLTDNSSAIPAGER